MATTVPNQRSIFFHKDPVQASSPRGPYLMMYWENFLFAQEQLTPTALILYLYFVKQFPHFYGDTPNTKRDNQQPFAHSSQAIMNELKISERSIRNAFNELVKKHFLIPREGHSTTYDFYEVPPEYNKAIWGLTQEYNPQAFDTPPQLLTKEKPPLQPSLEILTTQIESAEQPTTSNRLPPTKKHIEWPSLND